MPRSCRARFQREARAAAALNHPNIVHLYSVEEAEGLLFMTMELVQGRTCASSCDAGAPLPVPKTLAFASQMAEGLACAHAAGILHRDLKPGNVMITEDDRVKILDFGVAKFFDRRMRHQGATTERAVTSRESSSTGTTFGTAGYMSPEQALGKELDHERTCSPSGSSCSRWRPEEHRSWAIRGRGVRSAPQPAATRAPNVEPRCAGHLGNGHRESPRERPGTTLSVGERALGDLQRVGLFERSPRPPRDENASMAASESRTLAVCRPQSSCFLSST